MLLLVIAMAALVPVASPFSASAINPNQVLQPPGSSHLLGTDQLGRDLLARVAQGYGISLLVAAGAVAIALLVGVPIGLLAGYGQAVAERVVMRVLDVLMAFPALLLAIVMVAILGTGIPVLILAIGVVYVPVIARVMRSTAAGVSRQLFVEVAHARGASHARVLLRHVLPNSVGPVVVQASILMGIAVLIEAALSFLGLGVRPPTASLGLMLSDGRDFMASSSWVAAVPAAAIVVLVLAFTLLGDGLQEALDPQGKALRR